MARPFKTGIDYFPLDVDYFVDDKVIAVVGEFGIKGEAAVIHLLCAIYRNGYFAEWTDALRNKLDRELPGVSVQLLKEIVERLVRWGFFDKDLFYSSNILTSRGIQRRYFEATRKRKGDFSSMPYMLIPQARLSVPPVKAPAAQKQRKSAPQTAGNVMAGSVKLQKFTAPICGNEANARCLSQFFSEQNRANLEQLMTSLSLKPDDYQRVFSLAGVVITEWNATGTSHTDYSDWARHLVSLVRIKLQHPQAKAQQPQQTEEVRVQQRKEAEQRHAENAIYAVTPGQIAKLRELSRHGNQQAVQIMSGTVKMTKKEIDEFLKKAI